MYFAPAALKSAFRAVLSANQTTVASPEKLAFVKSYDRLGDFVDASNRFVAARAGAYFFAVLARGPNASGINTYLLKNGATYLLDNRVPIGITSEDSRSFSGVCQLSAGDYVEVFVSGAVGVVFNNGAYTVFSGHEL